MLNLWISLLFIAQTYEPLQSTQPSLGRDRLDAYAQRLDLEQSSWFKESEFLSIGPTEMSGRVVDLVCFSDTPTQFWAAFASGGLWRTDNYGSSWTSLFDRSPSITIGDIAINPNNRDEIWVGTGEKNSSRSSYAGTGIFRSLDGGKTWQHRGLADSHHISRVLLHPSQPNTLFVASLGPLYSETGQRGVFKSTDGGESWTQAMSVDDRTGVIDLVMDPQNPDSLLASAWERSRSAWNFEEGGPGSAIYRSDDGGATWQLSHTGLPTGANIGRIGIAYAPSQANVVYATVDNQNPRPEPRFNPKPLTRARLKSMTKEAFLAFDDKAIDAFLRDNNFHQDYDAESVRESLATDDISLQDLVDYMFDGNAALFDREVIGVELYRSQDGGRSWQRTHDDIIEDFAYSYGYYFGEVTVDPNNHQRVYITGVPLLRSDDGGRTFRNINEPYVHVDHHALWINPRQSEHMILGNDGGVDLSFDGGASWHVLERIAVGQFYTVAYDTSSDYYVYGGLQDNGVWRGKVREYNPQSPPWERIGGGDGAYIAVDSRDQQTVYWGFQFGHYHRVNLATGEQSSIYPRHKLKQRPYRFNWMTPFILSSHHQDIAYMGCQMILRSMDRGETWTEISPDLTTDPVQGDVPFGTVTVLRESKKTFGALYAGTDDGRVWTTQGLDQGWREITAGLPRGLWVSSIEVSPHDDRTIFVTLTGYRNDDFRTYVFKSKDSGLTWSNIKSNLPEEACNVIREDPQQAGFLFLGTDLGVWVSLDEGTHWTALANGLPQVPAYAMEIHPKEPDLIVATHGRSIFVLDLADIRKMNDTVLTAQLTALEIEDITYQSSQWGSINGTWWGAYSKPPTVEIPFFSQLTGTVKAQGFVKGVKVFEIQRDVEPGLQSVSWDFQLPQLKAKQIDKLDTVQGEDRQLYLKTGTVQVELKLASHAAETSFELTEPDND